MRQPCSHDNWDEVLGEVRRTIDRWFFWVSVTGFVYVEPRCRSLGMTDLADMVRRLTIVCEKSFPGFIAFEFSSCSLSAPQWNAVKKLVREFAANINATMLAHRDSRKTAARIVLVRPIPQSGTRASERNFPLDQLESAL